MNYHKRVNQCKRTPVNTDICNLLLISVILLWGICWGIIWGIETALDVLSRAAIFIYRDGQYILLAFWQILLSSCRKHDHKRQA